MAVSTEISMLLASVFAVLLFSTMQIYKPLFVSSKVLTIVGGYLGSWLFILALTAVSNLESIVLGSGFQAKLFPEIAFCLIGAVFACSMIHRVSATSCLIFSIISLYYINKLSQKSHTVSAAPEITFSSKKKRK